MSNSLNLFSEFTPVSKNEWVSKIEKDLKGKPLSDLQWKLGKLSIDPFLHSEDLPNLPQPFPGLGNEWEIGEDIEAHDLMGANKKVHLALENGVQAPRFLLNENLGDHRMEGLLDGIDLAAVSIHFLERNKNANPERLLHHFLHCAKAQKKNTTDLRGSVSWLQRDSVVKDDILELIEFTQEKLPGFKVLPVNAQAFYSGAGGVVEELANTIRKGEEWISMINDLGIAPTKANEFMQFSLSIGTNYFVEIAKIRALKILWANIQKAWGISNGSSPPIEAHFAPSTQSENPHSNMIQATTQAMSAVIGGVNRLTVLPCDSPTSSSDFGRRIARNVQHILKMESHLDWVADPAAGSYLIETLSNDLANAAWVRFQQGVD